jgi:uncharacterized protein (DUF433 family)
LLCVERCCKPLSIQINDDVKQIYSCRGKVFEYLHIQETMRWIIADPEICHGKPIFKGTRILKSDVLELLAAGESPETIVEEYPSLNEDMIREALECSS